jgi:hypothetical protein
MAECDALREWAHSTTPLHVPASKPELVRHLDFMNATLPSKNTDDETGKMRASVYFSILSGYTNEALAFMARRACTTLDWFPTPKQCLEILADYRAPVSEQANAILTCQQFTQDAFDTWLANVSDGQPIGDVPDQWKRIAAERGVLRLMQDGGYVIRSLYHGPFKRVPA